MGRKLKIILAALIALMSIYIPFEAKAQQNSNAAALIKKFKLELVTVKRIVDGDTFQTSDGRKIRIIGVNTPESTTSTEKFGKEASDYTKKLLTGKQVYLQKDVSDKDRYGRYLRIVWLTVPSDDKKESEIRTKMFNARLVINGYAEPSTYAPDVKYSEFFRKFAREARSKKIGLWRYGANGTTKGDFDTAKAPVKTPKKVSTPSKNKYFANCTEMRKVYPNGVPSSHPSYEKKHDRDRDGYACER